MFCSPKITDSFSIVDSKRSLLARGKIAALRCDSDLSLPKFVAGLARSPQKRLHVLEVSGENFFHHAMRQLGYQAIEHHRRVAFLVCEASPVQIIGVPRFSQ